MIHDPFTFEIHFWHFFLATNHGGLHCYNKSYFLWHILVTPQLLKFKSFLKCEISSDVSTMYFFPWLLGHQEYTTYFPGRHFHKYWYRKEVEGLMLAPGYLSNQSLAPPSVAVYAQVPGRKLVHFHRIFYDMCHSTGSCWTVESAVLLVTPVI